MAKPHLSFQWMVFPWILSATCGEYFDSCERAWVCFFSCHLVLSQLWKPQRFWCSLYLRGEKNSSSVAFRIVSIFFVGRKRCQQLSNLQSHRHKPMEQVILVRSLLAIWFSQTFFHPFLLILRRSKLAGCWSRLSKKLNMKDHLSSFLPLLHLLFVVDFAHLSKEFIVHCIASRNIMKSVAWRHHSCMLC